MSSSNSHSPCAACKFLRRKCTQECVFAPYFPPDQPQKFASVHKVYGASNVAKILNEMPVAHREEAVASLAYEAEARLRDPVYGCVGVISFLHTRLKQIQGQTLAARKELSSLLSSSPQAAMMMMYPYPSAGPAAGPQFAVLQHQHQHQQQQQQQIFGGGFEFPAGGMAFVGGGVDNGGVVVAGSESLVGLGGDVDNEGYPVVQVQQQPHGGLLDYQIQAPLPLSNVPHHHNHHHHQDSGADNQER